jgi:hypothetical protein
MYVIKMSFSQRGRRGSSTKWDHNLSIESILPQIIMVSANAEILWNY